MPGSKRDSSLLMFSFLTVARHIRPLAVCCLVMVGLQARASEKLIAVPPSTVNSNWCQRLLVAIGFGAQSRSQQQTTVALIDPLNKLREEYGPELRKASDFEVEYINRGVNFPNHTIYWYDYNGMEAKFCNAGGNRGYWLLRTKDKQNYYSLAAELPRAHEIARDILPVLVPDGFVLSSDGLSFIPQNAKNNGIDPQPTVAALNSKHKLDPKTSPAIFVVAANSNMTNMFANQTSSEFMEYLSRGEVPIVYGWPYGDNVRIAEDILQLARTADWARFRKILTKARTVEAAANLMAHQRWQATGILSKAYWLLIDALYPRLRSGNLTRADHINQGLAGLENALEVLPEVTASRRLLPHVERMQGDSSFLKLRPSDLALFMNDWKFASIKSEEKDEYWFFYWLKNQISRDYGSSGNSIGPERLQLRVWVYLQLPELSKIEVLDNGFEGYRRWVLEVERRLGTQISLRRVPYSFADEYHKQAEEIYFKMFWKEAFDQSNNDGARFRGAAFPNAALSEAFSVLGFPSDVQVSSLTMAEIKAAYRKEAMKQHPDRNNSSKDSEKAMKRLNEAIQTVRLHFGN